MQNFAEIATISPFFCNFVVIPVVTSPERHPRGRSRCNFIEKCWTIFYLPEIPPLFATDQLSASMNPKFSILLWHKKSGDLPSTKKLVAV